MTRHYEDLAKPPFFKDSVTVTTKTRAGIKPHKKAAMKEKTKG